MLKREPPSRAHLLTPVKRELSPNDLDEAEDVIDIEGDFSSSDEASYETVHRGLLRPEIQGMELSDDDDDPAESIDILYFGDDSQDDYEELTEPPKKMMRTPGSSTDVSPKPSPFKTESVLPDRSRRTSTRGKKLLLDLSYAAVEGDDLAHKKKKNNKPKRAPSARSDPIDEPVPPSHVAICARRYVPVVDQYDQDAAAMEHLISVEEFEAFSEEAEHSSDDEMNADPILIEVLSSLRQALCSTSHCEPSLRFRQVVPEWMWPDIDNHPFFLHDKDKIAEANRPPKENEEVLEIDVLGSSSDSESEELPVSHGSMHAKRRPVSSFSAHEQPSLSSVKDRNLHTPSFREVADYAVPVNADDISDGDEEVFA